MTVEAPWVVIEVSSESTAEFDRREKFDAYRSIPTLQCYVIVDGSGRRIDVFARPSSWQQVVQTTAGEVDLPGTALTLSTGEVYAGTT